MPTAPTYGEPDSDSPAGDEEAPARRSKFRTTPLAAPSDQEPGAIDAPQGEGAKDLSGESHARPAREPR
jgi:hypothetical protein